jgi:cytochrome c
MNNNQSQGFIKPVQAAALLGLLGLFALAAPSAFASDAKDLAKKSQCMSCHKEEGKLVGPAFKDVAAKYKGDAEAMAKLTAKVKNGGKGVWGSVPMPPNKTVSDDNLKTIVGWILSH